MSERFELLGNTRLYSTLEYIILLTWNWVRFVSFLFLFCSFFSPTVI